ncbi:MAG: hypothetical protein LUG66_04945 [Clostridiales bacterium]|nr:hypothetical protein [Clostridiales bacterium]
METIVVIMEKDPKTGFLDKEIASLSISKNVEYIVNLYAQGDRLFIKLSDEKELKDWEFNAVYDYFDPEVFSGRALEVKEVEDSYNPTWELKLPFNRDNIEETEKNVCDILEIFKKEINDVYEACKDKEADYLS